MGNLAPTSKVTATGSTGAAGVLLVWMAGAFGLDLPPEVAAAAAVVLATAAGYFKTERAGTESKGRHSA